MRQASFGLALIALALGCGSVDDHPLGGPYGGTGGVAAPSQGGANPSSGNGNGNGNGTTPGPTGTVGNGNLDSGAPPAIVDAGGNPPPTGVDAGGNPPPVDAGQPPPPATPTWTALFQAYLSPSSPGRCATGSGCHSQMSSAGSAYTWLQGKGDINGASSPIANPARSRLLWEGGNMPPPPGVTSLPQAEADFKAWAAAGAPNN